MHDKLEPTLPVSRAFPLPKKKRKSDVPSSEDDRAAGNRLARKPKGPPISRDVGRAEGQGRSGLGDPGPFLLPTAPSTFAPLLQAKSKKRPLVFTTDSPPEEDEPSVSTSRVPQGRSQRQLMGLTKVLRPRPDDPHAKTGRSASDLSISAEEYPSRQKKKIKLTHPSQQAELHISSTLTATQQRRKSAVIPVAAEVIEILSDSEKLAKHSCVSAPGDPADIIDITDTEDAVLPPQKSTQSAHTIELKYDADGSIIIDDDNDNDIPEQAIEDQMQVLDLGQMNLPLHDSPEPVASRWITPLSPSVRRPLKTVYGGPTGFFKDVYASRKMRYADAQDVSPNLAVPQVNVASSTVDNQLECVTHTMKSVSPAPGPKPSREASTAAESLRQPATSIISHVAAPMSRPVLDLSRQVPEGASLTEVINFVWQERTKINDLTLDNNDEERDNHVTPVLPISLATKEEAMSPSVSMVKKRGKAGISTEPNTMVSVASQSPVRPSTYSAVNAAPGSSTSRQLAPKPSLDSIRLRRRQMQKRGTTSWSNTQKQPSMNVALASGVDQPLSLPLRHPTNAGAPQTTRQAAAGQQEHSEEDAPLSSLRRRWQKRARRETTEELTYGPSASRSPSQGKDSEGGIASDLDVADTETSDALASSDTSPPKRKLRPRNKLGSAVVSGHSSLASSVNRSTRSTSSSSGPAELSDDVEISYVEPRIASPSDDPDVELTSFEQQAKKAGFHALSWQKDHRRMMREYANYYVLAKNLPHELQDQINTLSPRARKEGDMQVKLFEQAIIENTFEDEPHAPAVRIVNDIDTELTPPFEFHYSNLMWHGEGVPKPDVANLQGCGCLGPCNPKSKTCACVARQKQYHPHGDGFLYQEGRNKGQLKAHDYPIFECNDFCGCSNDCPNRVVQHGRKFAIEIRKTRHKGWGVFAGPRRIPKNTFIGLYAGEYLVEADAERRGAIYNKFGRTYLFDIDFYYLKIGKDDWSSLYSVDAYHAGNFTRYLNHSCDPNCCINACYINEANLEKPLLTIFTLRDVAPGEELCFSYYGNNSDDDNALAEDNAVRERKFDDAVYIACRCGARNCKGYMWKE